MIIRHCDDYDAGRIRQIVRESLEELGLSPHGRTLVKPNVVCSGEGFEHAYTRPEFVEGVLLALQDRDRGPRKMTELAVGERCGITIPTRYAYAEAGYDPMLARHPEVKRYCFEEESQVEIRYTHEGRLRDYVFTPEPVAKADFFVNCPKFKAHPWTTVTFGNKAYIGIQDDRHRLIDHDTRLDEKIGDLQYIIQPQFLVIDAIIAGEGRMLTPIPRRLNLIIMGDNQCAFDSICCRIIGLDPHDVAHIRIAHERGFGPLALDEIDISGDVSFEEARQRAAGFKVGLVRVEKYFEGTSITAYAGPPPASEGVDYCWGGCPGAIEEAIEMLRQFDKQTDAKMPRLHLVFGNYQGGIDWKEGEKVVFIGDCAEWKGKLGSHTVNIENIYRHRSTLDPYSVKNEDIFQKMVKTRLALFESRNRPFLRLSGCPVSVAEQLMTLVAIGGLNDPTHNVAAVKGYLGWKGKSLLNRLEGRPYQISGPTQRGDAAPEPRLPSHDSTGQRPILPIGSVAPHHPIGYRVPMHAIVSQVRPPLKRIVEARPRHSPKKYARASAWVWVALSSMAACGGTTADTSAGPADAGTDGIPAFCHDNSPCDMTGDWDLVYVTGATKACSIDSGETLHVSISADAGVIAEFGSGERSATLSADGCDLVANARRTWEEGGEPQSDIRVLDVHVDGDVMRGTLHHEAWWSCQMGGDFDVLGVRKGATDDPACSAPPAGPGCVFSSDTTCPWNQDDLRLPYDYSSPPSESCDAPTADFVKIWADNGRICAALNEYDPLSSLSLAIQGCTIDATSTTSDADGTNSRERRYRLAASDSGLSGSIHYQSSNCELDGSVGPSSKEGPYTYLNWSGTIADDPAPLTAGAEDSLFTITFQEIAPGRRLVDLEVLAQGAVYLQPVPCSHIDVDHDGTITPGDSLHCTESSTAAFDASLAQTDLTVLVQERVGDNFPQRLSLTWTPAP